MAILNSEHTQNSLSISLIHFVSIIFSRINCEFTIFFAKILWRHYPFREFMMNPLFFMRIHYEFTIFFQSNCMQSLLQIVS